jgi:hypothetical protein
LHELALSSDAINMVINAANTWSTGIKASLGVPVHERAGLAFSRAALFWALSLEMQMEMGVLRYTATKVHCHRNEMSPSQSCFTKLLV